MRNGDKPEPGLNQQLMKIGFVSLPVPGHFNPMSALARRLQSRNHGVVVLSLPLMEPLARAADLSFIPFGAKEFPDQASGEILATLSRLKGEEGLQFTAGVIAEMLKVKWRELPKLLSANGIDAVVLDNYDFYVQVVPMRLGMPYAVLSNALHFDYSGSTPLCVYGWAHENTPAAKERNRQGVSKFAQMLIRNNAEIIAEAERAGIKPNWEDPSSLFSDVPWITQCPREFDFQSAQWSRQFHYAGPLPRRKRPARPKLSMRPIDWRAVSLCVDGITSEWQRGCISHNRGGGRKEGRATSAFHWPFTQSRADRSSAEECDCR